MMTTNDIGRAQRPVNGSNCFFKSVFSEAFSLQRANCHVITALSGRFLGSYDVPTNHNHTIV